MIHFSLQIYKKIISYDELEILRILNNFFSMHDHMKYRKIFGEMLNIFILYFFWFLTESVPYCIYFFVILFSSQSQGMT